MPATRCRAACSRTWATARHRQGLPTIATFNAMGYNVATFGNHEFDWGQANLADRTTQATYPYVSANIVENDTGNCATAGWTNAGLRRRPYEVKTVGTAPNTVKVAFIGVTTTETPTITDRHRHRRPVLQGSGRFDPALLRRDEGRRRM